jgi:benzoate membrane transport protein
VLLVTLFPELSINEAVAAYITAAVIIFLIGITGLFDKVVQMIPKGVAAAMMAGILFDFGLGAFRALDSVPLVTTVMIVGFVLFKFVSRAYFLVLMVGLGILLSLTAMDANLGQVTLKLATPVLIVPEWSWSSTLGLALPLVIVSLTGQFLPGFAILKASGYTFASRPIISLLSLVSIPTAFFGGITTVIAAITASICTSPDAHENPDKRYWSGVANGVFYLIGGIFAGTIVLFFTSFPGEMIAIIAGLALLGAISNSLSSALEDKEHLDASLITFMATASGVSLFGIGSAFWGVVLGSVVYAINHLLRNRREQRAQAATSGREKQA